MKWYEAWIIIITSSVFIISMIELYIHQNKVRQWEDGLILKFKKSIRRVVRNAIVINRRIKTILGQAYRKKSFSLIKRADRFLFGITLRLKARKYNLAEQIIEDEALHR